MSKIPKWLKPKAYLHLTPSVDVFKDWRKIASRIQSSSYIAQYAFFPLIYRELFHRRYKAYKGDNGQSKRAHSHKDPETGIVSRSIKVRPIHYASHHDSLIYAYYASILNEKYSAELQKHADLNQCVIAYRSIPVSDTDSSGKCNIHFAKEVFDEITTQVNRSGKVGVLAMDIKGFFSSLSHEYIKKCWADLINEPELPPDHLNVFNACTNFSYIRYDDLRKYPKGPFDESRLAKIRRKHGYRCFFGSNAEFRQEIKAGRLPVYKNSFPKVKLNGSIHSAGIPQGLPVSTVLANLYLLEFDRLMLQEGRQKGILFYRRYSDDIIILCAPGAMSSLAEYVTECITTYGLKISQEKTEQYLLKNMVYNLRGDQRITSIRIGENRYTIGVPITYLGLEFNGYKTLIKSTNLAKYYRRLIYLIKSRAQRANKLADQDPTVPRAVYLNQIKKLYNAPLRKDRRNSENKHTVRYRNLLVVNERGDFEFSPYPVNPRSSNFISYVQKCDRIFGTRDFSRQLHKRHEIIYEAIKRHLKGK